MRCNSVSTGADSAFTLIRSGETKGNVAMEKRNRYPLLLLACVFGVALLIFAAMLTYPIDYRWEKLHLSALGLTSLRDGTPNPVSAALFNSALILAGVMTGSYFFFRGNRAGRPMLTWVLRLAGIVGGAGLAGIGLTPYNLAPHLHDYCTWIASAGLILGVITAAGSVRESGTTPAENQIWIWTGLFTLLIWIALEYLRRLGQLPNTPVSQLQQKILVLFFWLYMLWNSLALLRARRKSAPNPAVISG